MSAQTSTNFRSQYKLLLAVCYVGLISCCCANLLVAQAVDAPAKSSNVETSTATKKITPGDELRVIKPGAEVHQRDKSVINVASGTRVVVSKVRGEWIGAYVLVGDKRVPGWVLRVDLAPAPAATDVEAAIAELAKLGVSIERDAANLPHSASGEDAQVTEKDLKLFLPLVDLQEIDLSGTKITGAGLSFLGACTGLERLYLDQTGLNDAGLAAIGKLTGLTGLSLSETKITDAGLKHLKQLENLKVLNLADNGITDQGLVEISSLKGIETLTLSRTKITGTGFEQMQDFQDLITLNLDGCELAAGTLQHFMKLKKIRIMRMYDATAPEKEIEDLGEKVNGLAIFR